MKKSVLVAALWLVLSGSAGAAVIPDGAALPREAGAPPLPQTALPTGKHRFFPVADSTSGATSSTQVRVGASPLPGASRKGPPEGHRKPPAPYSAEKDPALRGAPVRVLQPVPRAESHSLGLLALLVAIAVLLAGSQLRKARESGESQDFLP